MKERSTNTSQALRLARNATGILIVFFLAQSLFKNFSTVFESALSISTATLVASALLSFLGHAVAATTWATLANSEGISNSWHHHARIWTLSRLGRYVPGKILSVAIRIGGYTAGSRARAARATLNEQLITLICSLAFIAIAAISGILNAEVDLESLALPIILLLGLLIISPLIVRQAFYIISIRRPEIGEYKLPSTITLLLTLLLSLLSMLLHGASLFLLISQFRASPLQEILPVTAYYYMAGLVGMLAFLAPGGLGVREGALAFLLQGTLAAPVAIACAVVIRCISLATELIFAVFIYATNLRGQPE